ncbi:MAG TPA: DMT family transporter [Alphaproteobacteria bacterium]
MTTSSDTAAQSTAAPGACEARTTFVWGTLAPALFVLLWSTGFIGAKAGLPYAEPFTFVAVRYGFVVALMLPLSLMLRAPWPGSWREFVHIAVAGLLMHAVYIAGVFAAIAAGLPAGITALIVGLQPVLTATVVGPVLGERVRMRQWLGLLLGLAGVALVLADKLDFAGATLAGVALATAALFGITFGTIYQKRFCAGADLRTGAVIQFAAAGLACLAVAVPIETMRIVWSVEFVAALAWLVIVLSIGTVSLLYLLLRRGAAAKTASLFYLVPPVTALFAWLLFGETLGPTSLAGMVVAAIGVALVQKG